jgi:hypothetical protein
MRWQLLALALLMGTGIALIVIGIGCSSGIREIEPTGATLEGTVTYGTEKVLVGMIIAAGDSGGAQGYIGDDGRYVIENAPLGEVKLGVNVDAGRAQLQGKIMSKQKVPKIVSVPAKYNDPNSSGLKTTVNKGTNTYDIVISK